MEEAATPIPATPKGANGSRLPPWKPERPITMNSASTASLMMTIIVFAAADSHAPRTSNRQHRVTRTIAGKLKKLPSPGAAMMASGSPKPNTLEKSSLRY